MQRAERETLLDVYTHAACPRDVRELDDDSTHVRVQRADLNIAARLMWSVSE